jgi:hypothetical protein
MTTLSDLPAPALRLITPFAQKRHIPGTNRFARVSRRWRDAVVNSEEEEQLQLLLPLESLPPDTVSSTYVWLAQHGSCVTSLQISYDPDKGPLLQQLPLSTAPLVGLAQLEVDGPDSLLALAPVLPQLVVLTHLGASLGVYLPEGDSLHVPLEFGDQGLPVEALPSLQLLRPGLKSLHLMFNCTQADDTWARRCVDVPVAKVLPDGLEQLSVQFKASTSFGFPCAALQPFTALRRITLTDVIAKDVDLLLQMPGLQEVDLFGADCVVDDSPEPVHTWLASGLCTAPQQLTKLTGLWLRWEPGPSALPSFFTALSNLRKLYMLVMRPGSAAAVQQLSSISTLRHLSLKTSISLGEDTGPAVAALAGVQQLTYLRLHVGGFWELPPSTWAAVLPHLTQLRVLEVEEELLLQGGLATELMRLPQLQCVYVERIHALYQELRYASAGVCGGLPALGWPCGLKAVLCWQSDVQLTAASQPFWSWCTVELSTSAAGISGMMQLRKGGWCARSGAHTCLVCGSCSRSRVLGQAESELGMSCVMCVP